MIETEIRIQIVTGRRVPSTSTTSSAGINGLLVDQEVGRPLGRWLSEIECGRAGSDIEVPLWFHEHTGHTHDHVVLINDRN